MLFSVRHHHLVAHSLTRMYGMVVRHPVAGKRFCHHVTYHLFPLRIETERCHFPSNCPATHQGNLDTPQPHVGQLRTPLACGYGRQGSRDVSVNLATMGTCP